MSTSKTQARRGWLGELEHTFLLAILTAGRRRVRPRDQRHIRNPGRAPNLSHRFVSTLDRLKCKGYAIWSIQPGTAVRAGNRSRRFELTASGLKALRTSHDAIRGLAEGISRRLTERMAR